MFDRPYAIRASRVALARPFQDIQGVRAALAARRAGKSIGFSRRASLVAMALTGSVSSINRVNSMYVKRRFSA